MSPVKKRGLFITFEGNEGAGKTTLIEAVHKLCLKRGYPVFITREPGGTPLAEGIRQLLLSGSPTDRMNARTELLLYVAARAEHVERTILPALGEGRIVLCDRYTDSSLAYQSAGRGLDWKWVKLLNKWATQSLTPHFTVFLEVPVKKGLAVATDKNRFEKENMAFHSKVRKGFEKIRREEKKRFLTLKGHSAPPEELAQKVMDRIIQSKKGKKK